MPWLLLREAGHQVVFATEQGGTIPAGDPRLLDGVIFGRLGAAPEAGAFYAELTRAPEFTLPVAWAGLDPAAFDGLLLPGGHAPGMRQYLGSPVLREQVARFWVLSAGRRDLPRRAGAGAHPRSRCRAQRPVRPPDDLPAPLHGTHGLPGHRVAAPGTSLPRPLLRNVVTCQA